MTDGSSMNPVSWSCSQWSNQRSWNSSSEYWPAIACRGRQSEAGLPHHARARNPDFNLVLVDSNSGWSTKAVWIKGTGTDWLPMTRNWGMNWQSGRKLTGQALSFQVTDTRGRTVIRDNVFPADWKFGQTATAAGF
ncbi:expansin C-terminal domain-related protein [Kutzneria sp. 744]|uniref:expansin C-terminal domain-related protein n=1 Tax=Kutzneria sp. (strain 744) TaxID=345341 RepID=UPI0004B3A90E|nr:expansin C-terminal domain-related protein [Kutzneria sp. 744]